MCVIAESTRRRGTAAHGNGATSESPLQAIAARMSCFTECPKWMQRGQFPYNSKRPDTRAMMQTDGNNSGQQRETTTVRSPVPITKV